MPYLSTLAQFRDRIRTQARSVKATEILKECDLIRDEILPNLGVRLEDREGDKQPTSLIFIYFIIMYI